MRPAAKSTPQKVAYSLLSTAAGRQANASLRMDSDEAFKMYSTQMQKKVTVFKILTEIALFFVLEPELCFTRYGLAV